MTRRSIYKKQGIPTVRMRYPIPHQVDVDLDVISSAVGWSKGEITTLALLRFIEYFVPVWNESHEIQIPRLHCQTLRNKGFDVRELMDVFGRAASS